MAGEKDDTTIITDADEDRKEDVNVDDLILEGVDAPLVDEALDDEAKKLAGADAEGEDADGEDTEGEDDGGNEEIRAARRARRQRRRETRDRDRALMASLKTSVDKLTQNQEELQKQNFAADMARLDGAINDTKGYIDRAKAKKLEALQAQDWDAVMKIDDGIMQASQDLRSYESIKERVNIQARTSATDKSTPTRVDPEVSRRANEWASKNKWYDPKLNDDDSYVLWNIDRRLQKEGFDPTTDEYWQELDRRGGKYLPHKYGKNKVGDTDNGQDKGDQGKANPDRVNGKRPGSRPGTSGGGSGKSLPGSAQDRVVPKEVVDAWREAGILDDPERLKKVKADFVRVRREIREQRA